MTRPGFVYAVQFDDLAVKVGQVSDALKRIGTHRSEAARHGRSVARVWSAPVDDMDGTEGLMIAHCLSRGTARRGTREYFTGVPWDAGTWDSIASHVPGTESVPLSHRDGTSRCPMGQDTGTGRARGVVSQMGQRDGTELVPPGDRSPLSHRDSGTEEDRSGWGPEDWDLYAI